MQYSDEFKQKVLSTLGDNEKISQMLDQDSEMVGRYLDDARYYGVSSKEFVEAYETQNFQGIYQKAKKQLALEELYREWIEMYQNQNKNKEGDLEENQGAIEESKRRIEELNKQEKIISSTNYKLRG